MTTSPDHAPSDAFPQERRSVHPRQRVATTVARYVGEALAIYLIYTLLGELNRQFTPPPSGISPIWLPAGFAVGTMLVRGWWTAIPLFLTGVVNTLRTDLSLTKPALDGGFGLDASTVWLAAGLFGLAVASHSVLAKLLVERVLRPGELDGVVSATAFLAIVGPVSCVASALLGTEVFRVEGFIGDDAYLVSAFTFWIGDSIACMLIGTAMVACFGDRSWRARRAPILGMAIVTALIVLASTTLVGRTELARIHQSFDRSSGRAVDGFERSVERIEGTSSDIATLVAAASSLNDESFAESVRGTLSRAEGTKLVADIVTPDGDIARSSIRRATGEGVQDFRDSWIVEPILNQLEQARDTGTPVWVHEADDPGAIDDFVYAPSYREGFSVEDSSLAERRAALLGYVALRTDLQDVLDASARRVIDRDTAIIARDERTATDPVVLAAIPRLTRNPLADQELSPIAAARTRGVPFATRRLIDVGPSRWSVTIAPSRDFVTDRAFLVTILPASLIALAFTMTIGVLALTSTGQRARLSRLVLQRTRDLELSERRYRSVVDNVREAIFQLDEEDRVTFASSAWDDIPGLEPSSGVTGRCLVDAVRVTDRAGLRALIAAARRAPGSTQRGEFTSTDEDHVVEVRVAAPDGDIGVVGMLVDITDQRAVLRTRERFVSMVAHELRNPLTVISGSVTTIDSYEQEQLPPLAAKLLPAVRTSADKLDRIISDLLVSSQVDAGTLKLNARETDLRGIVQAAITTARVAGDEHGVDVRDETNGVALLADCDTDRVSQVLDNLLSNAVKYTPPGGVVTVRGTRRDGHVEIAVRDDGIGIAPSDHDRIFERFGRTEQGATFAAGTGLGLAICRGIAEAHGGSITVESELGAGSEFVLLLPAVDGAAGSSGAPGAT